MNKEQAEQNVRDVKQKQENLEAELVAAESILLDIIANEPTEDKVIDMSHFIDSGLMMRFRDRSNISTTYDYLKEIRGNLYFNYRDVDFRCCQPLVNRPYASMEGWDKSPIPEGYVIEYKKFKSSMVIRYEADYNELDWSEIGMFRITAIKDGFKHE